MPHQIFAGLFNISLTGELNGMSPSLSAREIEPSLYEAELVLRSDAPVSPKQVRLNWSFPVIDACNEWYPGSLFQHGLSVPWAKPHRSHATNGAPVKCLHSANGTNRLTFAVSDALNPVGLHAGVLEETAEFRCYAEFFHETGEPIKEYRATLRLDARAVSYQDALDGVQVWWAAQPDKHPSPAPETARLPMYSTWYSFHQRLDTGAVETQCRLAKELGCDAVIVDDGWQTMDSSRGYGYCGDWVPERIPEMRAHVERIHALGMKFILWYGVPMVGRFSKAFQRFGKKLLRFEERNQNGFLDPRYPDVREYLIRVYEQAVNDWNLDGLKLDFVDSFYDGPDAPRANAEMDIASVSAAADRLLSDVIARLRAFKPDIMIEFRQSYIGPLMRKYGNMFRAADCPNDAIYNRVRTIELRLLSGLTPVHADMLMWNPGEPVERAALQVLNILFSVPQVSVLLDKLPANHLDMVRHYLRFWRAYRDTLLDGRLEPLYPEANYPVVIASAPNQRIAVAYNDCVVPLRGNLPDEIVIINATVGGRVVVDVERPGTRRFEILDCQGRPAGTRTADWKTGINVVEIPPSGMAIVRV
ncbi:MAG: glycoside hydrolase family 36 protein [Planctomycetota bacterium]